jgi:RNA polymerase sigma-70 factor (ECF subfamily)
MTRPHAPQIRSIPLDETAPNGPETHERDQPGPDAEAVVIRLYRENGTFVLGYVSSLLQDRHLAEDVVQETMLRAWRHCDQFSEQKGSVRGWLIRVAHNVAMDKIRMRQSRPVEIAEDAAHEALAEDHAEAIVTALHVRDALARLSPAHRAVIEEVYLNGRGAREAAARLDIPVGTVLSRTYYARQILRRELGAVAGAGEAAA